MKNIFISIVSLIVLMFTLSATALAKADFSGTWKLDTTRSEGIPPGMDQTMIVMQSGDTIKLETTIKTEKGEQKVADSYTLDGKEVDFTAGANLGNAKGKRTGNWNTGETGFVVNEKLDVDSQDGKVVVEFMRKWSLSPDGKTLTIEMNVKDPNGEHLIKRTFVKT